MEVLFDRDDAMGTVTYFTAPKDQKTFTLHEQQECQPIIDHVRTLKSMNAGAKQTGGIRYVGSIPMTWLQEQEVKDVLRSGDMELLNRWFLTHSKLMFQRA